MSDLEWIVCERSGRWAAALRTAFARQATTFADTLLLNEARSIDELITQLDERAYQLVLVEVAPANLEAVLAWLAEPGRSRRHTRAIALLNRDLNEVGRKSQGLDHDGQNEAIFALFEAGAVEIAQSPRRLQHILSLGRQCAAHSSRAENGPSRHESFADWAWAQLPWHDA